MRAVLMVRAGLHWSLRMSRQIAPGGVCVCVCVCVFDDDEVVVRE